MKKTYEVPSIGMDCGQSVSFDIQTFLWMKRVK